MATVDLTEGTVGHASAVPQRKVTYVVDRIVDFAAAATAKGSALASADVIQVMDIPAGTVVSAAGMEVLTAMTGTSTDLALDLGTGANVDQFVDGFDYDGAAVGALTVNLMAPLWVAADDTLDILIAAQTGTFLTGKVRVWMALTDTSGTSRPDIATPGS